MIVGAGVAQAQTTGITARHVSVWGEIGFEGDIKGNVNTSGVGVVAGQRAEIDINSWAERYDAALLVRFGVGFALDDEQEFIVTGNWDQAEADQAVVGLLGGQPLQATFTDYQGWGIDFGYRFHFATASRVKPFAEVAGGIQHVQEIHATFIGAANQVFNDVPFYSDSFAGRARAGGGLLFAVSGNVGVQIAAGLQFTAALKDQSGLGTLGFERVNNDGRKWNTPLTGGIYVHF